MPAHQATTCRRTGQHLAEVPRTCFALSLRRKGAALRSEPLATCGGRLSGAVQRPTSRRAGAVVKRVMHGRPRLASRKGAVVASAVVLLALGVTYAVFQRGSPVRHASVPSITASNLVAQPSTVWGGVYPGNTGPAGVTAFQNYIGQKVAYVTLYIANSDWKFVDQVQDYGLSTFAHQPYRVILSVPLLVTDSDNTLEQGAAGDLNFHFRHLAQGLVAMGMGNAIIRLGWELAGSWALWWAEPAPAAYAEYWRQVVTTMRSVPGADFSFDWNGGTGEQNWDPSEAYPGDSYVDYISIDIYDEAPGYTSNNPPVAATQRWWQDSALDGPYALDWTAEFAAAHHKPMGIPEWGLIDLPNGEGGGDDTTFLKDMYHFITTHDVAYADYFDHDAGNGDESDLTDGNFPKAAALYPVLFGSKDAVCVGRRPPVLGWQCRSA